MFDFDTNLFMEHNRSMKISKQIKRVAQIAAYSTLGGPITQLTNNLQIHPENTIPVAHARRLCIVVATYW